MFYQSVHFQSTSLGHLKKWWFIFGSSAVYLMKMKDKMKETHMVLSCTCSNTDVKKGLSVSQHSLKENSRWSITVTDTNISIPHTDTAKKCARLSRLFRTFFLLQETTLAFNRVIIFCCNFKSVLEFCSRNITLH